MKTKEMTIPELRREYYLVRPDGHWFDRDSENFFGTQYHGNAIVKKNVAVFVTSEFTSFDKKNRAFNVRAFDLDDGTMETIGEFAVMTKNEAHELKRKYLNEL